MRNPPLQAQFFVGSDGMAIPRARPITHAMRVAVFERDGYRCQACRRKVGFRRYRGVSPLTGYVYVGHVDHVFPRAKGGRTDMQNLRLLCEPCNESKAAD